MADFVTAFAPASIGNVAVGFDMLGLALEGAGDRVLARIFEEQGGDAAGRFLVETLADKPSVRGLDRLVELKADGHLRAEASDDILKAVTARLLARRTGARLIELPLPFGLTATERWMHVLGELFDRQRAALGEKRLDRMGRVTKEEHRRGVA